MLTQLALLFVRFVYLFFFFVQTNKSETECCKQNIYFIKFLLLLFVCVFSKNLLTSYYLFPFDSIFTHMLSLIIYDFFFFKHVKCQKIEEKPKFYFTISLFLLFFTALSVRFLTKRYIGEYDHQTGMYIRIFLK